MLLLISLPRRDLRPSSSRVVIRSFTSSAPQSAASASNGKSGDRSEKLLAAVKAKADQYKDALDKVGFELCEHYAVITPL